MEEDEGDEDSLWHSDQIIHFLFLFLESQVRTWKGRSTDTVSVAVSARDGQDTQRLS